MLPVLRSIVFIGLCLAIPVRVFALPIVLDFEDLVELDLVGVTYSDVTFKGAVVLTAGSILNEFEFPPQSGDNVVSDDSGPIEIGFTSPVAAFGANFTYSLPLLLSAYDSSNNLLGSISSDFANNLALSGDVTSSPNEYLEIASVFGIAFVRIEGDPFGGSFVLDDVTITPIVGQSAAVPESGTFALVLLGAAGMARSVRRRARCG